MKKLLLVALGGYALRWFRNRGRGGSAAAASRYSGIERRRGGGSYAGIERRARA